MAYACLYKSYGHTVDAIRADDITVTLARRGRPDAMFDCLRIYGCKYERVLPGLYRIEGLPFPTQVVVTGELDPQDHIWLSCMTNDLEVDKFRRLVAAGLAMEGHEERILVESVVNAVTQAKIEAAADAAATAALQGMQQGARENSRATIRRLLDRGGFSEADIADIAGTTVEEVRLVASGSLPEYA